MTHTDKIALIERILKELDVYYSSPNQDSLNLINELTIMVASDINNN